MGKFYGEVFYGVTSEKEEGSGVWVTILSPRNYYGDITRLSRRFETNDKVNGDITCNNVIRIVADAYAMEHFSDIRCVKWMGTMWSVSTVEVEPPRLVLTLGGVYDGYEA